MAKVFLACEAQVKENPSACADFERLNKYANLDRQKRHAVVDSPHDADIVVFVGSTQPNFSDIRHSKLHRDNPRKTVVLYTGDRAIPILRGIYACLEYRWPGTPRSAALAGPYLRVTDNSSLDINEPISDAQYLFSFVGNALNHPVRRAICQLKSSRAYLCDSSGDARQQDDGIEGENHDRGILYRDVMARSKFVLCPRGIGVSSWRLFEAMRAGRVPVILSDDWVRPLGPEWDKFCLFVDERNVDCVPELLERQEALAESYGAMARREWETWYSEGNIFNTLVDQLVLIHQGHDTDYWLALLVIYARYLEPYYFRHWLMSPLKQKMLRKIPGRWR